MTALKYTENKMVVTRAEKKMGRYQGRGGDVGIRNGH